MVEPFRQTADGSSPYIDVGALTALRALELLTDCDVPLALVYWTKNGVQFVDMGSVRRRPVSGPPSQFWPVAVAGGYPITGEAVSIQFQEQIADITRASTPQDQLALFGASDAFGYLPSIGLIPITRVRIQQEASWYLSSFRTFHIEILSLLKERDWNIWFA